MLYSGVLIPALLVAGAVIVLAALFGIALWFQRNPERRPRTGDAPGRLLGIADELYHPSARESAIIVEEQGQLGEEAPAPGDPVRRGAAARAPERMRRREP